MKNYNKKIMSKIIIFCGLFMSSSISPVSYKLTLEDYEAGLFSVFHLVLGALDYYEKSEHVEGLVIDFEKYGFYYDPEYGPNWLSYYFEIPKIGMPSDTLENFSKRKKTEMSLKAGLKMSRARGYELIQKYMPLKPFLKEKIDHFVEAHFNGNCVIGIHYRGTDKSNEASTYNHLILNLMNQDINNLTAQGIAAENIKIFIATDDLRFLYYMQHNFPGRIIFIDAIRSSDGTNVHYPSADSAFKKGEDAIFDCVLLSKCSKLYKCESNLSNAAVKFNPSNPVVELNPQVTQYYVNLLAEYLN